MTRPSRNSTNNNNRSNRNKEISLETQQVQLLKRLVDIQKTQQDSTLEQVPDVPRLMLKRDKVYTFARSGSFGQVTASNLGFSSAISVSLSQFPNSTDFTNLFEQYRIIQLTYNFIPVVGLGSGAISHPPLQTWIDQDDSSVPVGFEGFQTETFRSTPQGKVVERVLRPQLSQDGLTTTTSIPTGYSAPPTNLWVDDAYPTVLYYGLKCAVAPSTQTDGAPLWSINIRAVIQCRRPK